MEKCLLAFLTTCHMRLNRMLSIKDKISNRKAPTSNNLKYFYIPLAGLLVISSLFVGNASASTHAEGTVVIANRQSGDLTLIDVASDTPTNLAMPAGINPPEPMYVVYKRSKVFVGDRANDRVVVFDSRNWNVIGEVPTGSGVFHMWAHPKRNQLWVNNDIDNTITVINTRWLNVVDTIYLPTDLVALGGKPHDVILDKQSAFVTMIGLSTATDVVVKYDINSRSEVARADVGKDPHVTLSPLRGKLFVAAQNSDEVRVFRRNLVLLDTLTIPGAHGLDISKHGKVVYTTNLSGGGTDALFAIDAQTRTVIGSPVDSPFPVPHNIVLTQRNHKLYVTHSGPTSDKVSVYTVSRSAPEPVHLTNVDVGLNPFGLEFVPTPARWFVPTRWW